MIPLVAIIALFPLTVFDLGGPAFVPPPGNGVHVAEITSTLSFYPSEVGITGNETIEWRNCSLFARTVTDSPAKASSRGDSVSPSDAQLFSAMIAPGRIHSHASLILGKYLDFGEPHEAFDFLGRVVMDRPA